MKKVIIVGGGISGLIASYVFSKYRNLDVKLLEPGAPGGEFAAGGLKYIHRTDAVASMLGDLGLVFSNHSIRGGIMLHGQVHPYPKVLSEVGRARAERILYDHYKKTRRQEPSEFSSRAMNDPEGVQAHQALRCDFMELIKRLAERADIVKARLDKIESRFVTTTGGNSYPYDHLVLTIPLWVIKQAAYFHIPEGHAMRLNIVTVEPLRDPYARWDYVYTPYTPADTIHRFSPSGGGYDCEVNGELNKDGLVSDLNFIFADGWAVVSTREGLKGHLLPLPERPDWPEQIAPLGRFAKWDPRSTADVVAEDAREIAENWGWQTV